MANEIGAVNFDLWIGDIQVPMEGVQVLPPRIGRDYARTRTIGLTSRPSTIRTVEFAATAAAALTLVKTTYPALMGTNVTCKDSLDQSFTNVIVQNMVITEHKNAIQGGGNKVRVGAEWTLLAGEQT